MKQWQKNTALLTIAVGAMFVPIPFVGAEVGVFSFIAGLVMEIFGFSWAPPSKAFPWVIAGFLFIANGISWVFAGEASGFYIIKVFHFH
jgi:hypothetical protein